jgi:hypothetical protein
MAAADWNSGEKFAQPGGAKFRDFKEQKRRSLCGIYRGIFVARGQRNLSGIERENWDISQPVPTRTRNRIHAKEVHITPITMWFGTHHPLKFKVAHLTPSTMQYQAINPLSSLLAVLESGMDSMEGGFVQRGVHVLSG